MSIFSSLRRRLQPSRSANNEKNNGIRQGAQVCSYPGGQCRYPPIKSGFASCPLHAVHPGWAPAGPRGRQRVRLRPEQPRGPRPPGGHLQELHGPWSLFPAIFPAQSPPQCAWDSTRFPNRLKSEGGKMVKRTVKKISVFLSRFSNMLVVRISLCSRFGGLHRDKAPR